ncbi:hypothetical protein B0O99DRAFT_314474 [Bisporella sp. PMI_857]|nr:hypothetical protein B0O99DRAFT_314474 [Bisporella sp. PMI_857]
MDNLWRFPNRLIQLLPFIVLVSAGKRFDACLALVESAIGNETRAKEVNFSFKDHIYHGHIRGLDPKVARKPTTLSYEGCKAMCGGNVSDPHNIFIALSVLTTWVLPSVALFSNLPYEALSRKKYKKTFESFTSWIGSPQTALTNTFFNIYIMRRCQNLSRKELSTELLYRNVLYILSCIGQYEYRSFGLDKTILERRDRALVYGILRPLCDSDERDVTYSRVLVSHLAFQLRCNRRRGVFPVLINITWFMVSFAFSLVTTFANLGDNTTAHSLSLGIFVSWLPVLVCSTVTDRNPTASTRCMVLINRWLYNNEQILDCAGNGEPKWWHPPNKKKGLAGSKLDLHIDDFIGQGRRLRYSGVASALLDIAEHQPYIDEDGPQHLAPTERFSIYHREKCKLFRKTLTRRPVSWWVICFISHVFVSQQVFLAFVIAFNTPTVGLGCRSFLFLSWFLISLITSSVQVIYQEPPAWTRNLTITTNALNTVLLLAIMMLQVTNGLNNCFCKASLLGTKGYGGYTDLQNAQYYKTAFHVIRTWGPAAAFGVTGCLATIGWSLRNWMKSSPLWANNEDPKQLPELDDQVDMRWLI